MGKIKGWKKISENVWRNENTNLILKIFSFNDDTYALMISDSIDGFFVRANNRDFIKKETALRNAMKYMRLHPNG